MSSHLRDRDGFTLDFGLGRKAPHEVLTLVESKGMAVIRTPRFAWTGWVEKGWRLILRRGFDTVAGSDHAVREYVGPQATPVYEAAQHPGLR